MPFPIGRHVHPNPAADTPPAPAPTGIDYLRLVADRHTRSLSERLRYAQLADPPPDAALETELASFATLRPTDPTESTTPDSAHLDEADLYPEETR